MNTGGPRRFFFSFISEKVMRKLCSQIFKENVEIEKHFLLLIIDHYKAIALLMHFKFCIILRQKKASEFFFHDARSVELGTLVGTSCKVFCFLFSYCHSILNSFPLLQFTCS